MTEEEINEVRVRVLKDILDALSLATGDVRHHFEGGEPGIGTKSIAQIAWRLSRIRHGYVMQGEAQEIARAEDNTDKPAA